MVEITFIYEHSFLILSKVKIPKVTKYINLIRNIIIFVG